MCSRRTISHVHRLNAVDVSVSRQRVSTREHSVTDFTRQRTASSAVTGLMIYKLHVASELNTAYIAHVLTAVVVKLCVSHEGVFPREHSVTHVTLQRPVNAPVFFQALEVGKGSETQTTDVLRVCGVIQ